jgi:methylenetetrahydrofolate reductase (NADPH)
MQFLEKLRAGTQAVTLEITPPRKPLDEVLLRRARGLGSAADAVNVIQRSGRQPSLDASVTLRGAGLEPVWHLVTRGRSRAEIEGEIESAADAGLEAALCVRGETGPAYRPDTPTLRETVALVRAALPGACLGATANQYLPPDRVLRNLGPKLAAGATFVQTQPVLDVGALAPLTSLIRREFPGTFVVPMVMPLLTREDAERIAARLRISVPVANLARLAHEGARAGWAIFEETARTLRTEGVADGLAIMTPQMDPPPEAADRIAAVLRAL